MGKIKRSHLTDEVKGKLYSISAASVDKLLKPEKDAIIGKAISTTK